MAFNFGILVGVLIVAFIIGIWGILCYKRKTFCICCNNIEDFQPTEKAPDGTDQPQFSALSMAFYGDVGMFGDLANPKKVIEKENAEREAKAAAAEQGTSNFSKEPNVGDMIKKY